MEHHAVTGDNLEVTNLRVTPSIMTPYFSSALNFCCRLVLPTNLWSEQRSSSPFSNLSSCCYAMLCYRMEMSILNPQSSICLQYLVYPRFHTRIFSCGPGDPGAWHSTQDQGHHHGYHDHHGHHHGHGHCLVPQDIPVPNIDLNPRSRPSFPTDYLAASAHYNVIRGHCTVHNVHIVTL